MSKELLDFMAWVNQDKKLGYTPIGIERIVNTYTNPKEKQKTMTNTLDKKYTDLLQDILDNGVKKQTRNGEVLSVFGRQIRHSMKDGFPLLTTKKMHWKSIVTELLWFLAGRTDLKWLLEHDNTIWVGDAYKNYLFNSEWFPVSSVNGGFIGTKANSDEIMTQELFINKIKTDDDFAKKWGELGPVYGKQWRNWKGKLIDKSEEFNAHTAWVPEQIDQIANLINDLKINPDSRRLMVNAWNVGELDQMVLPPCHYGFQMYTRDLSFDERFLILSNMELINDFHNLSEIKYNARLDKLNIPTRAISLMWNQRSVDTFLGLPFNIASYGLLLEIIAKEVNMVPDELIGNLGDVHLYSNHVEQAKEQIGRELTTEERNEWHLVNRCGGNKRDCKTDWKDFELDQQDVPKRTREPYPLPTLKHMTHLNDFKSWLFDETYGIVLRPKDFILENYESHPTIKAPLSN